MKLGCGDREAEMCGACSRNMGSVELGCGERELGYGEHEAGMWGA